jgi:hypothetical protein
MARLRLGLVPATGRENNFPGVPPSSHSKFFALAGPPLRCGRERCGRPAIACPIAVKAAMGAT